MFISICYWQRCRRSSSLSGVVPTTVDEVKQSLLVRHGSCFALRYYRFSISVLQIFCLLWILFSRFAFRMKLVFSLGSWKKPRWPEQQLRRRFCPRTESWPAPHSSPTPEPPDSLEKRWTAQSALPSTKTLKPKLLAEGPSNHTQSESCVWFLFCFFGSGSFQSFGLLPHRTGSSLQLCCIVQAFCGCVFL